MRYIDQSLADGETILQRGKWPGIFWFGAWMALIFLGIIVVGIFIFIRAAIIMNTTDFAVTDRRVILKRGWLNRSTQELAVESVEGVSLEQSIIARIFGYGRIVVTGTGDAVIAFPPMANPVEFRRALETARARANEVHLGREDRAALNDVKVTHAGERTERRNVAEDEVEREPPPPKRRRRGSFIGLR